MTTETLSGLSLFSNCGAGDFGFQKAGFKFLVLAELVPQRLEVALLNHDKAIGFTGDLRKTWPGVMTAFDLLSNGKQLDLLAACPPCQGMSTARADRGNEEDPDAGSRDERNLLVLTVAHVAEFLGPRIIVIENVPAFLTRKIRDPYTQKTSSAAQFLASSLDKKYVTFPLLTDLADYGIPQTRRRSFLTLIRRDEPCLSFLLQNKLSPYPEPSHAKDYRGLEPIKLKDALTSFALPSLDAATPESSTSNHEMHFVPVWDDRRYRMVAAIPPHSGKSAWENDVCSDCGKVETTTDSAMCTQCSSPLLRPVVPAEDGGYRLIKGFRRSSYRRMASDSPTATITTASGRIGSDRTIHPWENRVLSPLECALLQTIPKEFHWGSALEKHGALAIRAMIGEAVPPHFTYQHGIKLTELLCHGTADNLLSIEDRRCKEAIRKLQMDTNPLGKPLTVLPLKSEAK